ncbi:MAG: class I SAM-dependent methyltransferase [Candidatus Thorarchaeota archaeon]
MTSKSPFLSIAAKIGEAIRRKLIEFELLDQSYKIISEDGTLFFPLKHELTEDESLELSKVGEINLGKREFSRIESRPRTLEEVLGDKLNQTELELIPRAYDLVGDIAILEIPDELSQHRFTIGEAFQTVHSNFETVLGKKGAISGTTRTRQYELLSGTDKTDTIHIEYGCRIAVDLARAYFSPRLLEEHNQVSLQVKDGEIILDLFTGVGPFAIHIAKNHDATIVAVDINPDAIELLQKSMTLNKLQGKIEPIVSDAHEFSEKSKPYTFDRVIMNHPSGAFEFVGDACRMLRPGGIMHYYDFIGGENPESELTEKITSLIETNGRKIKEFGRIRRVRDSAPYEYQMVIDVILH